MTPHAPKHFRAGTHRLVPPEETVERIRRLMPLLGITRIANVTGLDTLGLPVVMVYRPNSRSLAVSPGKGMDLASAKASGLMESVEGYHAENVHLPLKLASHAELRFSHPLVDVTGLPRLSASLFHERLRLLWVEGAELMERRPVWVPFDLVHTCFTLPLPTGSGAFLMSSNGLASGNHMLEATSHALCEVVERDATTLWNLRDARARRRTRLDLGTVDDTACREMLERYERAGVEVAVWETTTDVGIPAFLCRIAERAPDPLRPLPVTQGMGCHPSRRVALLRALTEAAQSRLTLISGARDDASRQRYEGIQDLDRTARALEHMRSEPPVRRFQDVPTFEGDSFDEDLAWELERLRAAGLRQVVVVDLTKRELGIPVVRVIIPGLEPLHDIPGYTPGARARRILQEARNE
uniref:Ribosomal protein S12 methylthiotransferase accessory factor n=1 Tax=Vitiosangium cumulatum TaxID=1867796 RepID=A0A7D4XH07_9BACT|nr:ribosomal protein S12 methylthiotransferase accessory factor [Vitiosangium cumulatum]